MRRYELKHTLAAAAGAGWWFDCGCHRCILGRYDRRRVHALWMRREKARCAASLREASVLLDELIAMKRKEER
jgi:hypothetical protein